MHRQIAGRLTGPVTKWIVLAVWLVILVVAGGFAAKLTDVQNNEASSWLPASAESTQALDKLEALPEPQRHPDRGRLPLRVRAPGQGHAGHHRETGRRVRSDGRRHRRRQPRGRAAARCPVRLRGRAGGPDHRDVQLRQERLERRCRTPPTSCGTSRRSTAWTSTSPGQGGQAADSAEAFAGHRRHAAARHGLGGHPHPADHLPQPGPVAAAGRLRRGRADHGAGGHLLRSRSTATSPSTARARASSRCWCSAPAPTTPCCWSRATARSCAGTRTGTRRWPSRCTAPPRRSSPARRRWSSACCACSSPR